MPYKKYDPEGKTGSKKITLSIFFGGIALSMIAGYVNAASLQYFHIPISHMSGAITHLGLNLVSKDSSSAYFIFYIIISFIIGAAVSGMIIGNRQLSPGRRYGLALMLEGAILFFVSRHIIYGQSFGPPLAALACGLQNGMASSYYGLVIRTTHMTGIVTDIGVLLGHFIRNKKVETWKLLTLSGILIGFFTGSILGSVATSLIGNRAFLLPSALTFLSGMVYTGFIRKRFIGYHSDQE